MKLINYTPSGGKSYRVFMENPRTGKSQTDLGHRLRYWFDEYENLHILRVKRLVIAMNLIHVTPTQLEYNSVADITEAC